MAERIKSLQYPVGGLNRRFAIQRRAPFTTPRCLEMRPFDPLEERERGGSRPGLTSYPFDLGETEPVNLLTSVTVSPQSNIIANVAFDAFSGGAGPAWATHSLQGSELGLILRVGADTGSARRFLPSNLHAISGYTVSLVLDGKRIDSADRNVIDGWATLDVGLADQTPSPVGPWTRLQFVGVWDLAGSGNQLVEVKLLEMNGPDTVRDVLTLYRETEVEGSIRDVTLSARHIFGQPGLMVFSIDIRQLGGGVQKSETITFTSQSGSGIGFALLRGFQGFFDHPRVRDFRIEYFVSNPPIFPTAGDLLVGASNGQISVKTDDGTIKRALPLLAQTTRPLMAVDGIVTLYEPAPPEPRRDPGVRLFIADYAILEDGSVDDRVRPKIFNPATSETRMLEDWVTDRYEEGTGPSKGKVPFGNTMIAKFLGRIFLAGHPAHAWHASRVNEPMDWDFGINTELANTDPSAATGGISGGREDIQEPIRAMAAYLDDYLIFATANALFRLIGDPGVANQALPISTEAGMAGPQAWCITPEGTLVFLDQERGLFTLAPGGQSYPQPLSANVLPRELKNINVQDTNVQLAYDHIQPGVHIILQSISGLEDDHWWYDRRTSSFWPLTLDTAHTPRVMFSYQGLTPSDSGVLLGGQDGVVRRFESTAGTDDGRVFTPSVTYGPFNLASSDAVEGSLHWIRATTISSGDEGLQFEIVTGRTALDALDENSQHRRVLRGRFDSEFMKRTMVRLRGVVAFVRVFGTETPWAIETLDVGVEPLTAPRP